jgi:hypothetical protein
LIAAGWRPPTVAAVFTPRGLDDTKARTIRRIEVPSRAIEWVKIAMWRGGMMHTQIPDSKKKRLCEQAGK